MRLLCLFCLAFTSVFSIDYSPWFERVLYFQGRATAQGQWGNETDLFRHELAFQTTVWTDIRAEVEYSGFSSGNYSYRMEAFKASGQYRLMNDIVGDPVTVVVGLTGMLPSSFAKREYALFYPGSEMLEAHLVVGKEFICYPVWFDRLWVDLAYGAANENSPWYRSHFQADVNLCYGRLLSLWISTLAGGGSRAIEFGGIYKQPFQAGFFSLYLMSRPIASNSPKIFSAWVEYQFSFAL